MFERETIADVCVGVVLAAGGGRRMAAAHGSAQGTAKPFVRVAGRRLIDYSIAALQAEVSTVIVNINQCDAEVFDLPVVPDLPGHSVGPLGGVVSALRWVSQHHPRARWVASVPCDKPFLPPSFVGQLFTGLEKTGKACVYARAGGQGHYVCALWPVDGYSVLETGLKAGRLRVRDGLQALDAAAVDFPIGAVDPFTDVNTPDAVRAAEQRMRERRGDSD